MNVTKLVNAASKYAPAMKNFAQAVPKGNLTLTVKELKAMDKLLAGSTGGGLKNAIDIFEKTMGKKLSDKASINLITKAAKIHEGGLMTGVVLKDGKNVVAKGAALINPQAGKAASINLKLRSGIGSLNSIFNPNEINANMLDNYFASVMMKGGKVHDKIKIGNAFKLHSIIDNNKYQKIFFEDPDTVKNAIAPEIDKIRNLLVNGKKPKGTLEDTFSKVLEKIAKKVKKPFDENSLAKAFIS